MTDQLKLLPCPFCGKEGTVQAIKKKILEIQLMYSSLCFGCMAKTSLFFSKAEAIESWNRRVESENYKKLLQFVIDVSYDTSICNHYNPEATEILKEIKEEKS